MFVAAICSYNLRENEYKLAGGYKRLQGVTRDYRKLQRVRVGYKLLEGVIRGYRRSQEIARG